MQDIREQFMGAWELVKWVFETDSGREHYPYGADAGGYIIYTPEGVVSATLMQRERPDVGLSRREISELRTSLASAENVLRNADSQVVAQVEKYALAALGYTAYSGPFSISGDTVIHHVRNSLYPDWVGTDLVRTYHFSGNQLLLSAAGEGLTDKLLWQRVQGP